MDVITKKTSGEGFVPPDNTKPEWIVMLMRTSSRRPGACTSKDKDMSRLV